MSIGQALKNALNELSQLNWAKIQVGNAKVVALQVTVHPYYSEAVSILISNGLSHLKDKGWEKVRFLFRHRIYFTFCYFDNAIPVIPSAKNFIEQLEISIIDYVRELTSNWTRVTDKSIFPDLYAKEIEQVNNIVMENPCSRDSFILLRILNIRYNANISIDNFKELSWWALRPKESALKLTNDFMIGTEKELLEFIAIISMECSPANYQAEVKEESRAGTLQTLCAQSISRYSLFYPELFGFPRLQQMRIPENLLNEIEDASMEHVDEWDGITKYRGRIIIYKTTPSSFCSFSTEFYLISPSRVNLRVGYISKHPDAGDMLQTAYSLHNLVFSSLAYGHKLTSSELKYANFKIRLPTPDELAVIKDALQTKKINFENRSSKGMDSLIDQQILETEDPLAEEFKKLTV